VSRRLPALLIALALAGCVPARIGPLGLPEIGGTPWTPPAAPVVPAAAAPQALAPTAAPATSATAPPPAPVPTASPAAEPKAEPTDEPAATPTAKPTPQPTQTPTASTGFVEALSPPTPTPSWAPSFAATPVAGPTPAPLPVVDPGDDDAAKDAKRMGADGYPIAKEDEPLWRAFGPAYCSTDTSALPTTTGTSAHGRYAGQRLPSSFSSFESEHEVTEEIEVWARSSAWPCFQKLCPGASTVFNSLRPA